MDLRLNLSDSKFSMYNLRIKCVPHTSNILISSLALVAVRRKDNVRINAVCTNFKVAFKKWFSKSVSVNATASISGMQHRLIRLIMTLTFDL